MSMVFHLGHFEIKAAQMIFQINRARAGIISESEEDMHAKILGIGNYCNEYFKEHVVPILEKMGFIEGKISKKMYIEI